LSFYTALDTTGSENGVSMLTSKVSWFSWCLKAPKGLK